MDLLLPLAAKSLLIAGITLAVLQVMKRRSAADRSFVAHLGLAALAALPAALFLLPQLQVETSLVGSTPVVETAVPVKESLGTASAKEEVAPSTATFPSTAEAGSFGTADWTFWIYLAPAGLFLLLTLIALLRLVLLKAKANVLIEPNWLTALARAQHRMGFKHGTALLTSDELKSPISWGLMRPVILLNSEAARAHSEAEAIIAHELAHVARLDWVKLLLSRITVAIFWFNPLVWVLAREAHQLREEAADDAVLGSNIEDTEYARLLVGIARHECRGLLLGAHGVAPARTSLARRVQRVLDAASARAPGGWRWTAAAGFFAAGMAVPLATLQLVPMTPAAAHAETVGGKKPALAGVTVAPPPVAGAVANAIDAASSASAAAAAAAAAAIAPRSEDPALVVEKARKMAAAQGAGTIQVKDGRTLLRSPDGAVIAISPPDSKGKRRTILRSPDGATIAFADASAVPGLSAVASASATAVVHPHKDAIERAIELKAVGATPEYARAIRNAAPHLRLDHDDIVELRALGVAPEYLRELASSGYPRLGADEIAEAKAMGITGSYIRSIAQAGYGYLPMEKLVELKAVGVTANDIQRFRRSAGRLPPIDKLVAMKALGLTPEDLEGADSP